MQYWRHGTGSETGLPSTSSRSESYLVPSLCIHSEMTGREGRARIPGVGTATVTSTLGLSHVTGNHRASSVRFIARIQINKRPMFSTLQDCQSCNCHAGHQYVGFESCYWSSRAGDWQHRASSVRFVARIQIKEGLMFSMLS
jgi:hypothetical protein